MALLLVGGVAVAVLAISIASLVSQPEIARRADSEVTAVSPQAEPTLSGLPTTTVGYVPHGGIVFLDTRSEISARLLDLDFSQLSVGACFNVEQALTDHPETVAIDCVEPHFYQLYAIGEVTSAIQDYSGVDDFAQNFCHDQFLLFVDHTWYMDSHFKFKWISPKESLFPESRTVYCYLDIPGDYAWTGDSEGTSA